MGCGCNEPKKTAKYICRTCGKEDEKEDVGQETKSCCGQPMDKKEE